MPKERLKELPQTPSSIDHVGRNDDDTMVLERPIGRKAEKANRKRKDGEKDFGEYLAKKLHIFMNHLNKKKRLFISKRKGFEWMSKDLILNRKGFVLKLLKMMKE